MNILITSSSFPSYKNNVYDGKFVLSEAISYAKNGASVRIITPHFSGAHKFEKIHEKITVFRFQYFVPKSLQVLKKPGIPVYNQRSFLSIIQIPFLCLFFVLSILKHAAWADIIHAQWTLTAFLALPSKWFLGNKIVLTARGSDIRLLPKWLNRFIHAKVDAAIDCYGPQPWNLQNKKDFPARYIELPLIIHTNDSGEFPEDMRGIVSRKQDPFIVLFVGRFDYLKLNYFKLPFITLIYASKILALRNMNFHVFYIGDGDSRVRREILQSIVENDLKNHVTLLGAKTNVLNYMQFCCLGVGGIAFNTVSQEFTISGKTQIMVKAKDNVNTPWRHGYNCLFVKPNDPMDLADKLAWAINHRDEVAKMGKKSKGEMKKYIVDSQLGGMLYLREFAKVINGD
ncbi:MAG: glycosyltransferase family 4 protein [Desulfobacteraceae bacterium]|nr:glycosyltransferase family 4 protein [Desulfobacteraceae bacterium]